MSYGLIRSPFLYLYRQLYRQLCLPPKLRILEKEGPHPRMGMHPLVYVWVVWEENDVSGLVFIRLV